MGSRPTARVANPQIARVATVANPLIPTVGALLFATGCYDPDALRVSVAHWTFDGVTGSTVEDVSGHDNTGTLMGGAMIGLDRHDNGALVLDGMQFYMRVASSSSINSLRTTGTIALWSYIETLPTSLGSVLAGRRVGPEADDLWSVGYYDTTYYGFTLTDRLVDPGIFGGGVPAVGTWVHLAFVIDEDTARLYLNGDEIGSEPIPTPLPESDTPVFIGAGDNGTVGTREFVTGRIDDVRIYNQALSPSALIDLANEP